MKLHTKLFVALVAGIALGAALHSQADSPWITAVNANLLRPIGQIFLRSIFMIVVPMVFSALVIGVYDLGRGRDLRGVAGRTLGFTVVLSALSVAIGIAAGQHAQAGRERRAAAGDRRTASAGVQTLQANAAARQVGRRHDRRAHPAQPARFRGARARRRDAAADGLRADLRRRGQRGRRRAERAAERADPVCSSRCSTRACGSCTS